MVVLERWVLKAVSPRNRLLERFSAAKEIAQAVKRLRWWDQPH